MILTVFLSTRRYVTTPAFELRVSNKKINIFSK